MVDFLEDSHDIVDHEKFGNLHVLDAFEYVLKEIQTLDVVEEELELSLDEGYAIFKEHDSSTLEPIYDKGFTLLKELHDTTHMDPSHDETSIIWVSQFILLYPTIPFFAALVSVKYG